MSPTDTLVFVAILWTFLFGPATAILIGMVADAGGPVVRVVGALLAFVLGGPLVWLFVLVTFVAAAVRRS